MVLDLFQTKIQISLPIIQFTMTAVFISSLHYLGVEVDQDIENNICKVVPTQGGGRVGNCHRQIGAKQLMDDHILIGRISDLDFPLMTIICHPITAEKILKLSNCEAEDLNEQIEQISRRFFTVSDTCSNFYDSGVTLLCFVAALGRGGDQRQKKTGMAG